ncbi:MAG: azurin [Verrucomicrobiota bacterium]
MLIRNYFCLSLCLLLVACGGSKEDEATHDHAHHMDDHAAHASETPLDAKSKDFSAESAPVVLITGNDMMQFDVKEFTVKSGSKVTLVFKNTGKLPKAAMGHNVVILQAGTDKQKFATDSVKAADTDYVPLNDSRVLAYTKLIGPGEEDTVEFTAPGVGIYDFVCSFPGHIFANMAGIMKVVE